MNENIYDLHAPAHQYFGLDGDGESMQEVLARALEFGVGMVPVGSLARSLNDFESENPDRAVIFDIRSEYVIMVEPRMVPAPPKKKSSVLIPLMRTGENHIRIPHYVSPTDSQGKDLWLSYSESFEANSESLRTALPLMCKTAWVPPGSEDCTFVGELTVMDYHGGRSSSCYAVKICEYLSFGNTPSRIVTGLMSCSAFFPLISRISNGRYEGKFTARKQGQNYMIVPILSKEG